MRNAHLYRCMVGLIFISITLGVSLQQTPQQVRMEQDPLARTRKHIVDCVEPLCREVLPRENKLLFLATPVTSTSVRNQKAQVWTVDCLDAQNEQRLRLLWNVENNSLISLYQVNLWYPVQSHSFQSHPFVSKAQAMQEAIAWIERLAIIPHGEAQRCAGTIETEAGTYDIHFHLKTQSVTVCLNAGSDELRFIYVNSATPRQ